MTKIVQQVSGFCFYALGASFFLAYLLLRNSIAAPEALWWMKINDLPLLLTGILFGGTSVYLSMKPADEPARIHPLIIGFPLGIVFLFFFVLNFWGLVA